MNHHIGMRAFSMLLAFLLVSVTFMPLVSAESQKSSWQREVLEKNGFTVNNLEQTITSTEKLTDKVVYSGTYKIDVQKNVDGKMKRLNTEGIFTTTLNADGTIRMEGYPDRSAIGLNVNDADLSFITDIKKVGEADGKNLYRVNQQVSFNGKTEESETTIETPIRSDSGINADGTNSAKGMLSKTKYDLPSNAPWGANLLYNDVQASQLIAGGVILAAIAAVFGGTPGAIIGILVVAIDQVPALLGIAKEDIYVDIWHITWNPVFPNNIYMEVDYYYK